MSGMKVQVLLGVVSFAVALNCNLANGQAMLENTQLEAEFAAQPVPKLPKALTRAKRLPSRRGLNHQRPVRQASWQPPFGAAPRAFVPSLVAPTSANAVPSTMPGHASQAIAYFGSGAAAQTLGTMPPRLSLPARVSTSLGPPKPRSKPFSGASNGATVSPYLNLHRDENEQSAPNYYAFVQPQLKQQEQNRQQQSQIQKLQRQVQRTSAAPRLSATGAPLTGHRTRYMDTGGYFSSVGQ